MRCEKCDKDNKFNESLYRLITYYVVLMMAVFFSSLTLIPVYYYFINDSMILNYVGAFTMGCGWTIIFLILFSLFAKLYKLKL